jgi:hypothetical protein
LGPKGPESKPLLSRHTPAKAPPVTARAPLPWNTGSSAFADDDALK